MSTVVAVALAAMGLTATPTLAIKVRAACEELGIQISGTVPAALQACNEAMGIEARGPLLAQADELVTQLGLSFEEDPAAPPLPAPASILSPPRPPQQGSPMPKMVVFDLDFTLWRPELYQLSSGPPFRVSNDGCVLTARGERLELFPAARRALAELASANVPVAIASRASEVTWAHDIIRLMCVDATRTMADVIGDAPVVVQGGSKVRHLKHIAAASGVKLIDMLFFDNERSNIMEVEKLGCTCIYCPRGLTDECFRDGVQLHIANRRVRNGAAVATRSSSTAKRAGRRSALATTDDIDDFNTSGGEVRRPHAKEHKKKSRRGRRGR